MKKLEAALRIKAQTEGDDKIAALAREVEHLADGAGEAAPEFAALAAQLRKVGTQQQLIDQFARLKKETLSASEAMQAAQRATAEAARTLKERKAALDALVTSENASAAATKAAAAAVKAAEKSFNSAKNDAARAKAAFESQRLALHQVRGAMQAAGISSTDLGGALRALRTNSDAAAARIEELRQRMASVAAEGSKAGAGAAAFGNELQKGLGRAEAMRGGIDSISKQLAFVQKAFLGFQVAAGGGGAVRGLVDTADAYGQQATRIAQATSSAEEYEKVQKRLVETAQGTYRPLAEAQELYIRTADALRAMGYNTDQVLDASDSLSYLFVTNAASADKATSAINAFTKSIQSGKLDAEGWQSILAATPTVVDDIAHASGKTAAEIRKLGAAGKLTGKQLAEGLRQSVAANKALADSMPTTVADALTSLSTAWSRYVGEANKAKGVTASMVEAIRLVEKNLDTVVSLSLKLGQVLLAGFALKAYASVQKYAAGLAAAQAATVAQTRANKALLASNGLLAASTRALTGWMAGVAASMAAGAAAAHKKAAALIALRHTMTAASVAAGALRVALAATGIGLLVTGVGSLIGKLQGMRDEAEKAAAALDKIKEADISTPKGIEALLYDLKAMEVAGERAGEKIARALADKLSGLGKGELTDLQEMLAEPILAATVPAAQLEALLGAIRGRLADIGRMDEINQFVDKYHQSAEPALKSVRAEMEALGKSGVEIEKELADIFKGLGRRGEAAAEALARIFKAADLSGIDAIKTLAADLDQLKAAALVTGKQLDIALRERLAGMNGSELREFRVMAEMALQGTAKDAEMLARINQQVLAVSFDKLGVSAEAALGKVGDGTTDALEHLKTLMATMDGAGVTAKQQGVAIEMALAQAFGGAASLAGIDALQAQVKKLGESGKIGEDAMTRLAQAAEDARRKIEAQIPGLQSVEEAFKALGVVSDAALKQSAATARDAFRQIAESGKASAREIEAAFAAYAEKAVAANGGVVSSALATEAAIRGLQVRADEAGKVTVKSFLAAREETRKLAAQAQKTAGSMQQIGEAAEKSAEQVTAAATAIVSESSSVAVSWVDAATAASRYGREAVEAVEKDVAARKRLHDAYDFEAMGEAVKAYVGEMEGMDARQKALSSSGAAGVEDLRLRLLELEGSEEQIARARHARDMAALARQKVLLEIELRRAALRGDDIEAAYYRDELAYLAEQIKLTEKLAAATEKKRKIDATDKQRAEAAKAKQETERNPAPAQRVLNNAAVTINVNGVTDPVKLARLVEPELKKLERLAR